MTLGNQGGGCKERQGAVAPAVLAAAVVGAMAAVGMGGGARVEAGAGETGGAGGPGPRRASKTCTILTLPTPAGIFVQKFKIHASCEIEDFVETYLCKHRVIMRSRVRRGAFLDFIGLSVLLFACGHVVDPA